MKPVIKDLGKVCITPEGDWDIKKEYANLSIVFNRNDAKVYISKQCVPIDTDILNTDYWHLLVDFDSIVNDMTALEIKNHVDNAIKEYIGDVSDEYNSLEKISNWIVSYVKTTDDKFSELRTYIKNEINSLINGDVAVAIANLAKTVKNGSITFNSLDSDLKLATKVINDLTTTSIFSPLSAYQGVLLKNMIDVINGTEEGSIDYKISKAIDTLTNTVIEELKQSDSIINNSLQREANTRKTSDDNIKSNSAAFGSFYANSKKNSVEISYNNINYEDEAKILIPAATTETAGVMSAGDKNIIDTAPTELLNRIQGTSDNSSASNDPFKRYSTNFSSVADAEFMEALNTMHSTDSTSRVEGFWRLYIGRLAVEVKNVAIKYVDDTWLQTIKLPYKWYKSSNKFGIDDDGNYRVHTYYRIHKDGAWENWIEVEEELKSAITAEETRAKAEEVAIRKLITDLIGESPETLDSIHEISSWILNDKTGAAAMAKAISENKTAIEAEVERAAEDFEALSNEIGREISARISSDNDIKTKAVLFGMAATRPNTNSIDITYHNVNQNANGTINIPAATTEKAGVMTANDKTKIETGFVGTIQTSELIKLNSYTQEGVFNFINVTFDNGSPINSNGIVSGRLTVFVTNNNDNKVVTQVLNLNNNESGEGNIYLRSCQNGKWKPWAKLQTNIDVGIIDSSQLDNLIDSGIYSGIIEGTGETFIIICINNYTVAQEIHNIAQLKYSLVLTHEVKIEKRIRNVDNSWSEWESVGSGSTLPEATEETIGGVKLGICYNDNYAPLVNINEENGSGVGIMLDSDYFQRNNGNMVVRLNPSMILNTGIGVKLGTSANPKDVIPCVLGSDITDFSKFGVNNVAVGIPYNSTQFCLKRNGLNLVDDISSGVTKITWDANSNMNNFKTPGVYDIYGERTRQNDNLPITNASSGHSIAARLTVVASTLQPANNEICVTQFLQLSNRVGGEGNTYIRTYNENNNGMNGWSPWQKQMGMVETLINSNETTVGQEIFSTATLKIGDGLNGMIDNGMYSGIYIDNLEYTGTSSLYYLSAQPTFVETFVLVVVNDYAASGKLNLPRHITQLKYAVDAITGQSTVKKRVGTGSDSISWSDWEDIGGTNISGGGSQEVDITAAVQTNNLYTLIAQGYIKEGVTYKVISQIDYVNRLKLDLKNKIVNHISVNGSIGASEATFYITIKIITGIIYIIIDCYNDRIYYKYNIITRNDELDYVTVSAAMTEL